MGQEVGDLAWVGDATADQQGVLESVGGRFVGKGAGEERPVVEPLTVTVTAQVNLHGNLYDVDPCLAGTRVELVFDPFDLNEIDVRQDTRSYGKAVASRLRRHVHPKARADTPPPPAVPTGIDYLRLIEERHIRTVSAQLQYAHLADPSVTASDPEPDTVPPDTDGHHYDADLLALADTQTAPTEPSPTSPTSPASPDPALEADLAGFAALAAQYAAGQADTDPHDSDHDADHHGEHGGAQGPEVTS